MVHCRKCAALALAQMEIAERRPNGAPIDIWRCKVCGHQRACRPGWKTRCHMCLDVNFVMERGARHALTAMFRRDPRRREFARSWPDDVQSSDGPRDYLQTCAVIRVLAVIESLERPAWTMLAIDAYGLPYELTDESLSHGSWAVHDSCGNVQKITPARAECRYCPPEPSSRSHWARSADPHLLYLVRYRDLLKFGHGDTARVRAHQRAGCEIVQVIEATHGEVVAAETSLKLRHRIHLIDPAEWDLPATFGVGSEVVGDQTGVDLTKALTTGSWTDVTYRFQ